jgi:hypothetical protein
VSLRQPLRRPLSVAVEDHQPHHQERESPPRTTSPGATADEERVGRAHNYAWRNSSIRYMQVRY